MRTVMAICLALFALLPAEAGILSQPPQSTRATYVDDSGTVTSTGVYQTVLVQNYSRWGCFFQNQSAHVETLRINSTTLIKLAPDPASNGAGGFFECPPSGVPVHLIEITGTTADAFSAVEW